MDITDEVVKNVAELAQLRVDNSDLETLQTLRQGMQNILDLAEQMQAVDTTGIAPVSNPLDAAQIMRPDEVTESNQREAFQAVAPMTEDGLYLVPRVVE